MTHQKTGFKMAQDYARHLADNINDGEYGDASEIIQDALEISLDQAGNPEILITFGGPTAWIDPVNAMVCATWHSSEARAKIDHGLADELAEIASLYCEELAA